MLTLLNIKLLSIYTTEDINKCRLKYILIKYNYKLIKITAERSKIDYSKQNINIFSPYLIKKALETMRSLKNIHEQKTSHKVKYIILLTGDHTTPIWHKEHSYEPVPIVITTVASAYFANRSISEIKAAAEINPIDKSLCMMRDNVTKFSEINACEGSLGRFQGSEMMGIIKRFKEACAKCVTDSAHTK